MVKQSILVALAVLVTVTMHSCVYYEDVSVKTDNDNKLLQENEIIRSESLLLPKEGVRYVL